MILRAPLFFIYHFEMTNNMKMMILKDANGDVQRFIFSQKQFHMNDY
jgi:hypothetical protein